MKILAGEDEEPLPDKKTVRELEKKLRKKQRLIRVWEPALEGGRRSLIFELADGTLWQLSDVGLGQNRFEEVGQDWKEHQIIKPIVRRHRTASEVFRTVGLRIYARQRGHTVGEARSAQANFQMGFANSIVRCTDSDGL